MAEDESAWVDGGAVFIAKGKSVGACKELPGGFTGSATQSLTTTSITVKEFLEKQSYFRDKLFQHTKTE